MWLARKLIGDPNLEFVEMPALAPPEVNMDPNLAALYEKELQVSKTILVQSLLIAGNFFQQNQVYLSLFSVQVASQTALPDEEDDL